MTQPEDSRQADIHADQMRLPRSRGRFVSHVFALITGNGIAQGVQIAGTLVLARLCSPDSFGLFAIFITVVSLFSVLGGARYELGIMLPESDEEAANILFLSTLVLLAITGLSALSIPLFRGYLDRLLSGAHTNLWLWTIPLALFVNGFWGVLTYWFGRMKRFRNVAVSRVCQSGGTVVAQLGLLAMHTSGGFALVNGWIVGQSAGVLYLAVQSLRKDGEFFVRAFSWSRIRTAAGRYRNFPLYKAPYSFVVNGATQLVIVILKVFSSLSEVGLYSVASRAVYLPTTLIASSMNQVFYEKAATELKSGRLEHFVVRLMRLQAVLGAPLLVLAAFEMKLLFGFSFGARWAGAGAYASLLAFAGYCYFISGWLDRLFDVQGRQRLSLVLEIIGNALSLAGLSLVLWYTRNTLLAVGTFAGTEVLYSFVWLWFAYRVAGFDTKGLVLIGKDAIISGGIAAVLLGAIHSLFAPWPAFLLSCGAVVLVEGVAVVRYLRGGRAFASPAERFGDFWAQQNSTRNHSEDPEFYRLHASELKQFFPPDARLLLEIGCGDGSLFPHLDIAESSYTGIDFSPRFIERFRSRHPAAKLQCAEGASYLDSKGRYDVILLNGVVQHFDRTMLEAHLGNALAMMHDGSVLIWGSVLHRARRRNYDAGLRPTGHPFQCVRLAKSWLTRMLGLDQMGFWYEPSEIAALAAKYGLQAAFFPSATYPYRFHAVLKRRTDATQGTHRPSPRLLRFLDTRTPMNAQIASGTREPTGGRLQTREVRTFATCF